MQAHINKLDDQGRHKAVDKALARHFESMDKRKLIASRKQPDPRTLNPAGITRRLVPPAKYTSRSPKITDRLKPTAGAVPTGSTMQGVSNLDALHTTNLTVIVDESRHSSGRTPPALMSFQFLQLGQP